MAAGTHAIMGSYGEPNKIAGEWMFRMFIPSKYGTIWINMVLNHPQIWELPTVQRDARQSNGSRTDFSTYSTWGQCCLVIAADFSAKIIHAKSSK